LSASAPFVLRPGRRTRGCGWHLPPVVVLGLALMLVGLPMVQASEAESVAGDHGFHEPFHTLGVFIGDTTGDRRAEEGVTLGLEYEYRATEMFGVGFIAEHVAGDFDTNVFVLPAAFHRGSWKLYAGPGLERGEEDKFLLRVGIEYGFHFGKYEVSPQLDLDFVGGERLFVFGVVFAREL